MNNAKESPGRCSASGATTRGGHVKYNTLASSEKRLFWAVLMACAVALIAAGALGVM